MTKVMGKQEARVVEMASTGEERYKQQALSCCTSLESHLSVLTEYMHL